jgi:intein-encoded DNA endonuclease-like protein
MPAKIEIPKAELERMYWKEGISSLEIARKLHVCKRTVLHRMQDFGIARRTSALSNRNPLPSRCNKFSPDMAYILGVYHGDGSANDRSFRLAVKDKDFAEHAAVRLEKLGFPRPKLRLRKNHDSTLWEIFISNKNFVELLNGSWDLDFSPRKNWTKHYLMGLFDSEGCVKMNKCITFSNTDTELVENIVKPMLNSFGIQSHIYRNGAGTYGTKDVLELGITGKNNIRSFHKYMRFSIKRKQERLEGIIHDYKMMEVKHV